MTQKTAKQYAGELLDRLVHLDTETSGAFYEMGQILSAIVHGKLYDVLGYHSFTDMVECELSFTQSTAAKYLHTYRHFRRLHYTKAEALALIREFSFTRLAAYLPGLKQKVGKRAISNGIAKMLEENRQINFQLSGSDRELLIRVLEKFGAEKQDGRLMHSSSALMELVKQFDTKPALRAVS